MGAAHPRRQQLVLVTAAAGELMRGDSGGPDPAQRELEGPPRRSCGDCGAHSVVFRSSGQDLTTTGTYTEITSRLAEPVLLGLAVLAVRSRVKR